MPLRLRATPQTKYRSKAKVVDGIRFHSTKEANRYLDLKLLEKAGHISRLELQPVFELRVHGPNQRDGEIKIGEYHGDFHYLENSSSAAVVEDVKGFKTPLYRWKKKHVEAQYGITIREV